MMKSTLAAATLLTPFSLALASPAHGESRQSVEATVESQDFSDDRGSVRVATLEYKAVLDDTTVVFSPTIGERRGGGAEATAVGFGATVYHDWSASISSRTRAFVAEDEPVFANRDFAQDLTVKVADKTTVTVGGRWARFFDGQDVTFLSIGGRRYFKGGSVAYRLTRSDVDGRGPFLGHLVNLSINDAHGEGKTQFWLSTGTPSVTRAQLENGLSGQDRAAVVQRIQPLSSNVALVATAGLSSYDRPGAKFTATNIGIGLRVGID